MIRTRAATIMNITAATAAVNTARNMSALETETGGKSMKFSVIVDSKTGNTRQAAEWIAQGMNRVADTEARAFSVPEIDEAFVKESSGIVVGSPSYAAQMTPDLHAWLLSSAGKLGFAGKLGGAFATEQFTHGGGEAVIESILIIEMVNGMLCYSGGGACGMPVIHLGPVGVNNNVEKHNGMELYRDNFIVFGERFAKKASEIFG